MRDNARVAITPRCDQHAVRHIGTVIKNRLAPERGHFTIRLMHDQIGGGEIPVPALSPGEGRIDPAIRDTA